MRAALFYTYDAKMLYRFLRRRVAFFAVLRLAVFRRVVFLAALRRVVLRFAVFFAVLRRDDFRVVFFAALRRVVLRRVVLRLADFAFVDLRARFLVGILKIKLN
jgi:hypothetical protein